MVDNRPTILLVDDETLSLDTMARILDEEFDVKKAASAAEAHEILQSEAVELILADQRMPEETGVEFLARVREHWPEIVRIIISGYTEAEDIIRGVNEAGIYQYIAKPWHPDNLLLTVRNGVRLYRLQRENELLSLELKLTAPKMESQVATKRDELLRAFQVDEIVRSPDSPLNEAIEFVRDVAPYDVSVLVTGESGCGKELFARAIHYNSLRCTKPFLVENCGAIPNELLESELFGHKRGAFTGATSDRTGLFEEADGGTIFLDEIGDVTPEFQVKLLRVLQGGEYRPVGSNQRRTCNVRIIAATNRDLEEEVRAGRFREDLYYRIAEMTLRLPALRERPNDIPRLAEAILKRLSESMGKPANGFAGEALAYMQQYAWPGNVRELGNEIKRMLVLAKDSALGPELLSPRILRGSVMQDSETAAGVSDLNGSLKERVELIEASILRETLVRHRWNKSRAAEELGLSRVGLRSKLERYGLEPKLNS